ncbi:MAG: hypothetical protein PHP95_17095 [Desulfuromonadaceae bacterium]|nr:hypothetical protein [Desulfuromonadaceae bacterium]MDD2850166.1 hypothetical protein [Desulfuromonadaceae bacterium]MDD4130984.1 hypothetical protein [Desulfuromonadaceae bacterium]
MIEKIKEQLGDNISWPKVLIAYLTALAAAYGAIWAMIEPMSVPDTFSYLPPLISNRIFWHLILALFLASNLTMLVIAHLSIRISREQTTSTEPTEAIVDCPESQGSQVEMSQSGEKKEEATLEDQETQNNGKIKSFPESTVFFYERFCSAFPGVRGIEWFSAPGEAISRLSKLLEPPLGLTLDKSSGTFNPIWWWRGGNLHIYKFEQIDNDTVLLNGQELKINKIAAVNPDSYYRCFVYVETKPMEPTGLYPRTKEEIEQSVDIFGYCTEEYGLFKDKFKVSRAEYDDGAAKVNGSLVEIHGESQLRVRYITPYNMIIAAQNSPLNNSRFDQDLEQLMNNMISGKVTLEQVEEIISQLPKRESRG